MTEGPTLGAGIVSLVSKLEYRFTQNAMRQLRTFQGDPGGSVPYSGTSCVLFHRVSIFEDVLRCAPRVHRERGRSSRMAVKGMGTVVWVRRHGIVAKTSPRDRRRSSQVLRSGRDFARGMDEVDR